MPLFGKKDRKGKTKDGEYENSAFDGAVPTAVTSVVTIVAAGISVFFAPPVAGVVALGAAMFNGSLSTAVAFSKKGKRRDPVAKNLEAIGEQLQKLNASISVLVWAAVIFLAGQALRAVFDLLTNLSWLRILLVVIVWGIVFFVQFVDLRTSDTSTSQSSEPLGATVGKV